MKKLVRFPVNRLHTTPGSQAAHVKQKEVNVEVATMTVGELKKLLDAYPEDYRVGVVVDESEEDLVYQDFMPFKEHDPGLLENEKLLLLYLDTEETH